MSLIKLVYKPDPSNDKATEEVFQHLISVKISNFKNTLDEKIKKNSDLDDFKKKIEKAPKALYEYGLAAHHDFYSYPKKNTAEEMIINGKKNWKDYESKK